MKTIMSGCLVYRREFWCSDKNDHMAIIRRYCIAEAGCEKPRSLFFVMESADRGWHDTTRTEKLQVFVKEFRSVLGDKRRLVFDNKLPVLRASLIQYLGIFEWRGWIGRLILLGNLKRKNRIEEILPTFFDFPCKQCIQLAAWIKPLHRLMQKRKITAGDIEKQSLNLNFTRLQPININLVCTQKMLRP